MRNSLFLPLGALLLAVPVLLRLHWWGYTPSGLFSDLFAGSLLMLLLQRAGLPVLALALTSWVLAQYGTLELIAAVGRMPELSDVAYLGNADFVQQSSSGFHLAQPVYLAVLLSLSLAVCMLRRKSSPAPRLPVRSWLVPACALLLHGVCMQLEAPREPWKQYNTLHKLAAEQLAGWLHTDSDGSSRLWAQARQQALGKPDLTGTPLLPLRGKARNVLIVTMEGIPGTYIDGIRQARGYDWPQQPMPQLSRFASERHAMHTADYVVHSHQTIRGLYAMLCGDYDKLDSGSPKALEMLAAPGSERHLACLPAQLAAQGYATHFLQAADLAFMSKDQVMPHIGFQKVCGPECLKLKPQHSFAWGLDDQDFFAGALGYVDKLRQQQQPWLLTLLTVGTHQPYGAPEAYLQRYPDAKMAAVAYLDDTLTRFLGELEKLGVLDDTLVIVTSDESHGIDELRLASAWGVNLVFAPERQQLPAQKTGVYGHIDLPLSIMDYFGLVAKDGLMGRSLFRDYTTPREMLSYTNGLLRYLDADGSLHECQFQSGCRRYQQNGFITPQAVATGRSDPSLGSGVQSLATLLDHSLQLSPDEQDFLFAREARRKLKASIDNDWTDNLIGAQYLEFPAGTLTRVSLRVKALKTDRKGAQLSLRLKEHDRDSDVIAPDLPLLRKGESTAVDFVIDNPTGRRAFSFHLLGIGKGEILIDEFRITVSKPPAAPAVTANADDTLPTGQDRLLPERPDALPLPQAAAATLPDAA